ncbi:MAG TPA: patatin-like phospholipase family protein [Anaeromyxobacter sp.]|nr:patatin-like phospholipase family protein [Anaeromyxobacter sp.]
MADERRLGLALSGGGFRASLFHLGVLSRLAELDLLRQVEIVSTVSGGSILGGLYCLEVKNLLEAKSDDEVTQQDYVELVDSVMRQFIVAVQRNIRTRAYADPVGTLRMAFDRAFTRSDKLAQLYDALLFSPAAERNPALAQVLRSRRPDLRVRMTDLRIVPRGATAGFHPKRDNRARKAKVPMLYVNATCLNTGRRWLFTPTWMGELFGPARKNDSDVNAVLKGFYYEDASDKYRNLPLAVAVAASAGLPGIFPPLPLTELYNEWTPQLVDGGVRDNLGLGSLDEELGVDFVLSDASDVMEDMREVAPLNTTVAVRAGWVMWDRIRDLTVAKALSRDEPVVYAKGGLPVPEIAPFWAKATTVEPGPTVSEIDPQVVAAIARIRTDLDAFGDVEADSLMGAGYLIATAQMRAPNRVTSRFPAPSAEVQHGWLFRWILPELEAPSAKLLRELSTAQYRFTKTLQLPIRALADWLLSPAQAVQRSEGGGNAQRPNALTRASGHLELALLDVADVARARGRKAALSALTAVRELTVGAMSIPIALADLAFVDWLYLAMERRPQPAPPPGVQGALKRALRRVA